MEDPFASSVPKSLAIRRSVQGVRHWLQPCRVRPCVYAGSFVGLDHDLGVGSAAPFAAGRLGAAVHLFRRPCHGVRLLPRPRGTGAPHPVLNLDVLVSVNFAADMNHFANAFAQDVLVSVVFAADVEHCTLEPEVAVRRRCWLLGSTARRRLV